MTWKEAEAQVRKIANGLPIYWGCGDPIDEPHVIATTKDAWSGEGQGYNVLVYPNGDGYGRPYKYHSVSL